MSQKIQIKCLVAILVLAFTPMAQSETPVVEWIHQFGTSYGTMDKRDVSVDGNENICVSYSTDNENCLCKFDPNGNNLWTEQLAIKSYDVSTDSSNNIYVTGSSSGNMILVKYDTNGNELWTEQLGLKAKGVSVSIDNSGNAYVTGNTMDRFDGNSSFGNNDIFLAKYDTNGTKQWTTQLGTSNWDTSCEVSVDNSGNVYITGSTKGNLDGNTNAGNIDVFLTKYNPNGTKQWTKQWGTNTNDRGYGVSTDDSGNVYLLAGMAEDYGWDSFLTKFDSNGTELWTKKLEDLVRDLMSGGQSIYVDSCGNTFISGIDEYRTFLAEYDTNGNKLWHHNIPIEKNRLFCSGESVSVDDNGNVYCIGEITDGTFEGYTTFGSGRLFLAKVSTVPEPATITLILAGLLALVGLRYRR